MYRISDNLNLVSKSKTVNTTTAFASGKELLVLPGRGLTGPQIQPGS